MALHTRLSAKTDVDMVREIGDSFRSLRGISCWCDSAETQLALKTILKTLNDRLESARGTLDSKAVVTILGGLKGIDYPKLTEPALSEVARTLHLVNSKLTKMEGTLNYQAVGTAIHSLGVATDVKSGLIQSATSRLLGTIAEKLPVTAPATLVDLGTTCSALYTLHPTKQVYAPLAKRLWHRVDHSDLSALEITRDDTKRVTSWSMIHQTFAIYGFKPSTALLRTLKLVQNSVDRQMREDPSAGELHAREVLSCAPEVAIYSTTMLAGFDLDIPAKGIKNKLSINFEVDGPHHDEPLQRRADRTRDDFFKRNLFLVVRIPSPVTDESIIRAVSQHGITIDTQKLTALRSSSAASAT